MSAEISHIRALLDPDSPDTWPQGILAAADLRERRAKAATHGRWASDGKVVLLVSRTLGVLGGVAEADLLEEDAEHIAAEANPRHSLDEVSLARTLAKVWDRLPDSVRVAAVQAARSYLGGGAA